MNKVSDSLTPITLVYQSLEAINQREKIDVVQFSFLELVNQLTCHTGVHDKLIKDPDGAYSKLIRLQQAHAKERHEVPNIDVSGSSIYKSRSLSLEKSIDRDSPRNKGHHSSTKSTGLSEELNKESGDSKAPKKAPIGRLFKLNKPEAPVLLLAAIAAFVHGLMFPSFSIMMSGGIRSFYYPPHQLRKDSRFWALMCLLFAVIALISIQLEYFLFGVAGGKLIQRVRSLSFQSIVHQEVAWFDDPSNSRFGYLNIFFSKFLNFSTTVWTSILLFHFIVGHLARDSILML